MAATVRKYKRGDVSLPIHTGEELGNPFTPTFHPDRLDAPLHWRKPRRVFVCNMGDLFHEAITDEQLDEVFGVMAGLARHQFLLLTKRPARMREYLSVVHDAWQTLPNVWLGVTVCNQEEADRNIPILLATPAAMRWVSIEPMLGPVDLFGWVPAKPAYFPGPQNRPDLDWVVLGGETGPGSRLMRPEWALNVYRRCKAAGVPFWFKQGGTAKVPHVSLEMPEVFEVDAMMKTHELPEVAP
jgi:protein gp37